MPVLGITGGVATGKSTFTRRLQYWMPASLFDADAVARELLENDLGVKEAVLQAFGPGVVEKKGEGRVDRSRLREIVFGDVDHRRKLEAILHPLIRLRWMEMAESFHHTEGWLFVDIPLLYETGAESAFETVAVVACTAATQRARIIDGRGLSAEMADRIIASQQSLSLKMARAGHVIWSDSPLAQLDQQARIFAGYLQERYG